MILIFFYVLVLLSCLPLLHSTTESNTSIPVCHERFSCWGQGWFKYPFYNATDDTRCGLIKVNCTSKGGEIQFGGRSYEISRIFGTGDLVFIRNERYSELVKSKSCEALMNKFISPSPSPLLYSISIIPNITLFKCPKNLTSIQQTNYTYFNQHKYNSYNECNDHNFYYNYFNRTVPSDLPHTCQVVQLPAKDPSIPGGLNETDIFNLLSNLTTIQYKLTQSCHECLEDDGRLCDAKNGHVQCVEVKKGFAYLISADKESGGRNRRMIMILVAVAGAGLGIGFVTIFVVIILGLKCKTHIRKKAQHNVKVEMFIKNHEILAQKRYSFAQVEKMTDSFKFKLGQGGFGVVYKGVLKNQNLVAVKVLNEVKGNGEDFINEVASVGRTSHVNIVNLLGFCSEGRKRALIYEFMPNGSLERFIYNHNSSNSSQLGWEKLHQIAIGIARGLEYLYRGCSTRILHFDIKPHNILLDNDFCPKISDFGLAKLFHEKESKISLSHMRGTPGYIAPELFSRNFGEVSHKSNVYSYGMMILEMVGGRKNIDVGVDHTSEIYFPHWIYKKLQLHEEQLGLHGIVCDEENKIAKKMIIVGLWCIQINPLSRPTITKVLEMLEGDLASLEIPPKPYLSSPPRIPSSSSPSANLLHLHCSSSNTS